MAQNTAQYEALQFREDKTFDFGALAMDAVKLQKEQEALDRKIKKEEEDFQMKMIADNPEVVHASFANSGLQNLDAYSAKVGELIKTKANEATQQYLKDKDRMKYFTTMAKLKGEVTSYTENTKQLVNFGSTLIEKGDDASAVMVENAKRIDAMFKTGTPGLDKDGFLTNISTIRDEDGNLISDKIKWGDAVSMTQSFDKTDPYAVSKSTIKMLGKSSKFINEKGELIKESLLDRNGNLEPSARELLSKNVDSLSQNEMIDIADQLNLEDIIIRGGRIVNLEQAKSKILEEMEVYTLSTLEAQETTDDVVFEELQQKRSRLALQWKQDNKPGNKTYTTSYYDIDSAKQRGSKVPFMDHNFTKPAPVSGLTGGEGFNIPVSRDVIEMTNKSVVGLRNRDDGRSFAIISMSVKRKNPAHEGLSEVQFNALSEKEKFISEDIVRYVEIEREDENKIRTQMGMGEVITDKRPEKTKAY